MLSYKSKNINVSRFIRVPPPNPFDGVELKTSRLGKVRAAVTLE